MNKSNRAQQKRDYETYTKLESVLQEMDDAVDAIVVEGIRDKTALKELGITKEIVMCSSRPDNHFVDYLSRSYKCVTILTDYDQAGKKFNKKLSTQLERSGVRVDNRFREKIGRILGLRGMRDIESVNALKKRLF